MRSAFDDGSTTTVTLRPGDTADITSTARAVVLKPIQAIAWSVD
ncbi:hypothetical protein [Kitasatospora sp. NPDC005856]